MGMVQIPLVEVSDHHVAHGHPRPHPGQGRPGLTLVEVT